MAVKQGDSSPTFTVMYVVYNLVLTVCTIEQIQFYEKGSPACIHFCDFGESEISI